MSLSQAYCMGLDIHTCLLHTSHRNRNKKEADRISLILYDPNLLTVGGTEVWEERTRASKGHRGSKPGHMAELGRASMEVCSFDPVSL